MNKPEGQIFRIDARGAFTEALNDFYEKGNMQHIRAIKYDVSQAEGSRITAKVDMFIPAAMVSLWRYKLETGRLRPLMEKSREDGKGIPDLSHSGGTGVRKLAAYGRPRPDGKAEFRSITFKAGTTKDLLLVACSGPGNEDDKGLITPGGKMEQYVQVPMSVTDLYQLLWTMDENYKAFLTSRYVTK